MHRDNVSSSNILSIGYDNNSETLEIEFHGGAVYQYYNVAQGVYDSMMAASSKGQFLHSQIKDRFPYSRV